ncbi:MAG: hypothetical protein HYY35_11870 [Deltaproteobacteria bacterium]|nr:hypothetical protein [Deltaproteobacteria bacterium]
MATKAVSVRIPEAKLRRVMRQRRMKSRSELIKTLIDEEDERIRSHQAHQRIFGSGRRVEFDDRLL